MRRARESAMNRLMMLLVALGALCLIGCASGPGGGGGAFGTRGVPWTIRCREFEGSFRTQHAQQVADTLRRTEGIRADDVFVQEDADGFTRLYYGSYPRRTDRRSGKLTSPPQMREDLGLVRQLGDDSGRRFFVRAMPVRMPQPDVGPPEWNLANVNAVYSLQVAAFEPTDQFWEYKRAAAEYCEFLRNHSYEAYYHHGPGSSVVTVGHFGPEAVFTDAKGGKRYSREIVAMQEDELLKYNLVNGAILKVRTGPGDTVPVPSRLVEVPRPARDR